MSDEFNTPSAVMMTIAEISQRDGVSKAAVSTQVKKLVERGLKVTRDARGYVSAVNVAQYDQIRERIGDPSKDQRPADLESETRAPDSYDEALRRRTWYEAERKRLELEEQIGKLIRVEELGAATDEIGGAIVAIMSQLPNETDALAAVVAREGTHGLRIALKTLENRLRRDIAKALSALAQRWPGAPEVGGAPT